MVRGVGFELPLYQNRSFRVAKTTIFGTTNNIQFGNLAALAGDN
jgi:hypothetical protein